MKCRRNVLLQIRGALVASAAFGLTLAGLQPASGRGQDLADAEESAINAAIAAVAPAVVRIDAVGGLDRSGPEAIGHGPTTGLIIGEEGWIVSSQFAFADKPDSILVTLADGRRSGARLVATDHSRRVVLLRINIEGKLPTPSAAPSSEIRVGQTAIAVGRTFDGGQINVSLGIVSALNRVWGKAIQTDAKISPTNYGGPLVDIQGRVIGLLTPLSSDSGEEANSAETYDAGIGFAAPLEHLRGVLPRLAAGHDLHQGVIGVSLKGTDVFTQPAIVAACPPNSPAFVAGVRPGDEIVEAAGKPVTRQAELRHQVAPRYVGDKLAIVVLRGGQRLPFEVEVVAKLPPFERPFLGILPMRGESQDGVAVRYVFTDGPAAKSGIAAGDVITSLSGKKRQSAADLADALAEMSPDRPVEIELRRGVETRSLSLTLARWPESVPPELPPARGPVEPAAIDPDATGRVEIKLPEFENQCVALVPASYGPKAAHGLVVWLQPPGEADTTSLFDRWRPLCEAHDLILVVPQPQDAARWQPREAMVVRRLIERMKKNYSIDGSRIVLHGAQAGGAMAYLVASAARNVVRGVAVVDAAVPVEIGVRPAEAGVRLAVYSVTQSAGGNLAARIAAGEASLRDQKHPVVARRLPRGAAIDGLTGGELADLARWIDSLDRL